MKTDDPVEARGNEVARAMTRRDLLKRAGMLGAVGVGVPLLLAACGGGPAAQAQQAATTPPTPTPPPAPTVAPTAVVATPAATAAQAAAPATPAATTGAVKMQLDLVILTGGMIGKKGWPAYIPSQLIAPANSTVSVQIVNFDDGTAPLLPDYVQYAKVSGVVGNKATSAELTPASPNTPGAAKNYTELDPKDVAHTFTIPDLNLNVPIPVTSIVTFTINTGKAGDYKWSCKSPCGTGADEMHGAMETDGYMEGVLHVV